MTRPSLSHLQEALQAGEITLESLVNRYLQQIEATRHLNIYVEVFDQEALEKARQLDKKLHSRDYKPGKLFGAVISIKDVLCYKDHHVSAGSRMLANYTSPYNATAIQRIIDEDAIIIGRTNCDEFAMGSTNEHSYYGPTLNGLDPTRVPGGSSGAAAVSVQQNTCLLALGSDTGGSVRQPAAYCGVVGFKPSYGRISRYGLIAYASSFDQIGIVGVHIEDIYPLLQVIEGHDPMDATSSDAKPTADISSVHEKNYKIAYFNEVVHQAAINTRVQMSFKHVLEKLNLSGHELSGVDFPLLDYLIPAYYVLTTAEASSNLSRYDGIRYGHRAENVQSIEDLIQRSRSEGFGLEVKRRIMMGTFVLSVGYFDAYFTKAQKVRRMIKEAMDAIFSDYDFLIMPTTPDIAPKLGEAIKNPVQMYLSDIFTVLANLCGYPAISLPQAHSESGNNLPMAFQLVGKSFDEARLLKLANQLSSLA